jgi:flagellar basal-body rod protein FlgF
MFLWHALCILTCGKRNSTRELRRSMSDAALSSLQVQTVLSRQMEIIADNIANLSTPGFKAEMMAVIPEGDGTAPKDEVMAVPFGLVRDIRAGDFTHTGNSLDLAIKGQGYFVVQTPAGERYTRNGRFQLDGDGQIINSSGYPVLGDGGGAITVPAGAGKITIGRDGSISTKDGNIGTIGIVTFEKHQKLQRADGGLFLATDPPLPAEKAEIIQGSIESSNVQAVIQITEMISVLRSYQQAQRIVETENERAIRAIRSLTQAS